MRRIIVFENVTVDGYFAGLNGELDWAVRDEEVTQDSKEGQGSTDLFLFGRVTYEMMASFWPTPAGMAANPVFAEALSNTSKIVFSKALMKSDWQHTKVMNEIDKDAILELKQQPGKTIMIFGSRSIVNQLARLGLIDGYQLLVNPVVLGKGKPLFTEATERFSLKLANAKVFKSGIVMLQYEPGREE
jgi:dihydrofolate reductase